MHPAAAGAPRRAQDPRAPAGPWSAPVAQLGLLPGGGGPGRAGPPEPCGQALPPEEIGRVDALLIPALAVDRGGRRLGQGGGWYDRLLPLRADGVRVFAMVHDDELVAGPLPTEAHDEPVDAVITPEEWFLLEGSAFASEC